MTDRLIRHRRSLRLPGHNYASPGAYYVTICTHDRSCLFGDVIDREVHLSRWGEIAQGCWAAIPDHAPTVSLDVFVVMPNHVHGIIVIDVTTVKSHSLPPIRAQHAAPLPLLPPGSPSLRIEVVPGSLGAIVRSYKAAVTRQIKAQDRPDGPIWQRNYYEHVVRDQSDLDRIHAYIDANPACWQDDQLHPAHSTPR